MTASSLDQPKPSASRQSAAVQIGVSDKRKQTAVTKAPTTKAIAIVKSSPPIDGVQVTQFQRRAGRACGHEVVLRRSHRTEMTARTMPEGMHDRALLQALENRRFRLLHG